MSDPFKLTIPIDATYRGLAGEVAAKYVELAGGSPVDVDALGSALASAIDRLIRSAHAGAGIDLAFRLDAGRIEVTMACEGRSAAVTHVIAALRH